MAVQQQTSEEEYKSLSSLLHNVPGVVYRGYPDWSVSFMGGELRKVTGYSSEDFVSGRYCWKNIIHPGDIKRVEDAYRNAVRSRRDRIRVEYRFIRKDGSIRWGMERRKLFYDDRGKFIYVDGLIMDVSVFKRTEEALTRRFEIERIVASISSDFISLPSDEIDEGIERALRRVGEFSGADRSYLIFFKGESQGGSKILKSCVKGVPSGDIHLPHFSATRFPWWMDQLTSKKEIYIPRVSEISPMGREEKHVLQDQDIKSLIAVPLILHNTFKGIIGFDSVMEEKEWIREDVSLLKMLAGAIGGAIERREGEIELRKSESQYRTFVENSLIAFGIIQDGLFRYVNKRFSEIFRCSSEDVVDRLGPFDFIHPDYQEMEKDNIAKVLSNEVDSVEYESRVYRRDGELFPARILVQKTMYEERPAIIGNLMDLSKERELRDQVYQAQKMEAVGRLTGAIAHDINNYLGAVSGFGELIKLKCCKECNESSYVMDKSNALIETSIKASKLIGQLLSFSRRKPADPQVMNINTFLKELRKMMEHLIGEDVDLVVESKEGISNVKVDPGQLEQVFVNLLVNSRDAMPEGGRVRIATDEEILDEEAVAMYPYVKPGKFVKVTLSDTGVGIPSEIQNKIFEPFFTTKGRDKGTGLGLSTAYGIVKQHEGYIWVKSDVGIGTTFTLFLPVCGEKAVITARRAIDTIEEEKRSLRILLVEDNQEVRRSTQDLLTAMGNNVVSAPNGEDALELCEQEDSNFDILITDVILPGMNGKVLAGMLREKKNLEVLFISGYTDEVISRKGILQKGVHFLQKPFSGQELSEKLKEIFLNCH